MARRKRLTQERLNEIAILVHEEHWSIDDVWAQLMPGERIEMLRLAREHAEAEREREMAILFGEPAKKAKALLRRLLTPEERRYLVRRHHIKVVGSEGGLYRIWETGQVERVEVVGKRWMTRWTFCWHAENRRDRLPGGDMAVAALLLIRADEDRFLVEANARKHRREGIYRRVA